MKMNRLAIDTGTPRSVTGHIVSGAIASSIVASTINYNRYKKAEIQKCEAIRNSLKLTIQGGIATSSAVAAANYLGQGSLLKMASAISVGIFGIYALEKLDEKLEQRAGCNLVEENCKLNENKGE